MGAKNNDMIVILGPTATGKTRLAALVAQRIGAEIISADSRQVYRGMDIGTGKDYDDYVVDGQQVPFHLIDIVEPGTEYNVYRYQKDFLRAYEEISVRGKRSILCGGTGMYIDAVLKGYRLIKVPVNPVLRSMLQDQSDQELVDQLRSYKDLHNITDTSSRKRLVRALEIQAFYKEHPGVDLHFPEISYRIFGVHFERETIRARITKRLKKRLESGMLEEVKNLLDQGVHPDRLKYYGLEYRYITRYLLEEISYDDMVRLLNTAIHQFAKRQMTWFRKMEREGFEICWLDGEDREGFLKRVIGEW